MKLFNQQNKNNKLFEKKFETIYKTYYARLFYYSFQFLENEETAKDIVNDVFEKIWSQRNELKEETLCSFLYTLVRNRCLDYIRHKKVEQQYADLYEFVSVDDTEDYEIYESKMSRIERIISELEEPTKSIFTKCYYLNRKYSDVANEYNISSNGEKKHIMKVLRLIRKEFDIIKQ